MYVASNQINAVAPYSLKGQLTSKITVEYFGVASSPVTVQIVPSMTGLFTANSTGTGEGSIVNQDSTPNSPANPASVGSVITLYATGMGLTSSQIADGSVPQDSSVKPVLPVTVTIDGQPATLVSAYATPGMLGVLTANVQVPSGVHTGAAVPIALQVGTSQSQSGVTMAIQ
jgi:uncharacterized protein (TIGR03437 family)